MSDGLTQQDRERIQWFISEPPYKRSPDDLLPEADDPEADDPEADTEESSGDNH